MKKTILPSVAVATLFLTFIGVDNAYAIPSFARQTGLGCAICHAGGEFPALTEMGRQFKLGGYTMGGGDTKMPLPLAAMIQMDMSSTKNGSDATAAASANGVNENNKINFPQMSVFYGGKIYDNFGAFVQITYDSSDLPKDLTTRRISADNTDIRYGNSTTLLNNSLVYGASLTNNPTLQDIYASTPAWGFPWATLATDVLKKALNKYPKPKIFNSDQGSQYTSYEHTQVLKQHDIQISMNGRRRSIDNIVIERFFRTLKHGNIYISDYQSINQSIKELKEGVKNYIHKYNFKRFHSAIGYKKPMNLYLEFIKNVG